MLDIKFIRQNLDLTKQAIKNRNLKLNLDDLVSLDDKRRKVLSELEELRMQKNKVNDEVSILLKNLQNARAKDMPAEKIDLEKSIGRDKINQMKEVSSKIGFLEEEIRGVEAELDKILLTIPNIPHESLPVGDPSQNKIVREWGDIRKFDFTPKNHIELVQGYDIMDLPRAAKITGSNFVLFKGDGARLQRALIDFMIDLHVKKHGYKEIWPPVLVNRASMTGTGQLPKLEEDMYRLKDDDLFLIPTAEVPVTNIHRDEIFDESQLPVYYTAYTPCFRREAGSYGKDTKGLMRVHQFDKVEMVKFVKPETSYDELEKLLSNAEEVLQLLHLPYRVKLLSTGDLSFAASKCYDIEVYAPGLDMWLEVSSCSNFCDFQARRANIRFRRSMPGGQRSTEYVHTLNGSGVALARTVAAVLENYQNADGSIEIPEILRSYFDGRNRIR